MPWLGVASRTSAVGTGSADDESAAGSSPAGGAGGDAGNDDASADGDGDGDGDGGSDAVVSTAVATPRDAPPLVANSWEGNEPTEADMDAMPSWVFRTFGVKYVAAACGCGGSGVGEGGATVTAVGTVGVLGLTLAALAPVPAPASPLLAMSNQATVQDEAVSQDGAHFTRCQAAGLLRYVAWHTCVSCPAATCPGWRCGEHRTSRLPHNRAICPQGRCRRSSIYSAT